METTEQIESSNPKAWKIIYYSIVPAWLLIITILLVLKQLEITTISSDDFLSGVVGLIGTCATIMVGSQIYSIFDLREKSRKIENQLNKANLQIDIANSRIQTIDENYKKSYVLFQKIELDIAKTNKQVEKIDELEENIKLIFDMNQEEYLRFTSTIQFLEKRYFESISTSIEHVRFIILHQDNYENFKVEICNQYLDVIKCINKYKSKMINQSVYLNIEESITEIKQLYIELSKLPDFDTFKEIHNDLMRILLEVKDRIKGQILPYLAYSELDTLLAIGSKIRLIITHLVVDMNAQS